MYVGDLEGGMNFCPLGQILLWRRLREEQLKAQTWPSHVGGQL